jgi:hypothetical protein
MHYKPNKATVTTECGLRAAPSYERDTAMGIAMGASGWGRDAAWAQVASLRFARGPAHGPPFNLFIGTVFIHAIINGPGIVLETLCSITLQAVLH